MMLLDLRNVKDYDKFKSDMLAKILKNCVQAPLGPCILWKKGKSKGYGVISYNFIDINGKNIEGSTSPHKMKYMLMKDIRYLKHGIQISHRCRRTTCTEIKHLIHESAKTNKFRQFCHANGECKQSSGVPHKPKCLFL